ncbi:hypothetical protein KIW84_011049 [Lathyrus oleraceus]|uniref:Uncharacterized protein n=1 Tax=Pisum sativum TaxID=3888 RepID=A0A9D4YNI5_PEA|nr:hypothetical protein KIW84_011049 [Pisum sativum]
MESVSAAQNQSSLTPTTPPPQRTVISEVATSTVPVASSSQSIPSMPYGFPWGMPSNFMPEGLTGASLRWHMGLDSASIRTFNDLGEAFVKQYKYNVDMEPDRDQLSSPNDFTKMVNMGMRLEEGVREGCFSKDEASASKKYGGSFSKRKEGETNSMSVGRKRRPHIRKSSQPRQQQ